MSRNIGREVREHLIERFSFVDDEVRPGQYRRPVDAQHQLVITDKEWHISKEGGHTSANLHFQVARRDINELRIELFDRTRIDVWWPTVKVNKRLFEGDSARASVSVADGGPAAYCDLWVPKFIEEAPRLSYIRELFEMARPVRPLWRSTGWARMLDALLDGKWEEPSEDNRFPELINDELPSVLAWVEEHPDGVERDVHGEVYETRNSHGEIEVANAVLFPTEMPTTEQFALLAAAGFNWFPEQQVFRKVADGEPGAPALPWLEAGWTRRS